MTITLRSDAAQNGLRIDSVGDRGRGDDDDISVHAELVEDCGDVLPAHQRIAVGEHRARTFMTFNESTVPFVSTVPTSSWSASNIVEPGLGGATRGGIVGGIHQDGLIPLLRGQSGQCLGAQVARLRGRRGGRSVRRPSTSATPGG